ncbi:hypothetical protein DVH05_000195 [Phytophthora capsici]|nr:hypothetical protein DVH05_000195 [Phytophthora capsici]
MAKFDRYKYSEDSEVDGDIFVSGKFSEHRLRISDWICDCEFSLSMRLPGRHAIAYRKYVGVTGPLIPWGSIDERWTTPNCPLKQVRQFAYEKFSSSPGSTRKKQRTQSERYREAVRATHFIASEMADIQDDDEFEEMLKFVLTQWRNVRQRKMEEVLVGKSTATDAKSVCDQVSSKTQGENSTSVRAKMKTSRTLHH